MRRRPRAGTRPAGLIGPDGAIGAQAQDIETDRLLLRPITAATAAALVANHGAATELLGAVIPAEWPHPNLIDFLPQLAAVGDALQPFGALAIVERATNEVVGDIGFHGRPDTEGRVEVGYSIVPSRRRRGYAAESLAGLVAWTRRQPGVTAVTARCEPTNVGSIRTLEGGGFDRVGERDGLIEWRRPV
jgi:ribosomal-protein-alanine N-acetyltransferase